MPLGIVKEASLTSYSQRKYALGWGMTSIRNSVKSFDEAFEIKLDNYNKKISNCQ